MLPRITLFIILLYISIPGQAQLVTKKDYTASFALQAGAESGIIATATPSHIKITPTAGLKMTFPFNRKWFIGSEINYSQLKTRNKYTNTDGQNRIELNLRQIAVPLYLKYMLRSNQASLLLGGYATYYFDNNYHFTSGSPSSVPVTEKPIQVKKWDYGFIAGYEQQLIQRLNLTFKISCGILSPIEISSANKKFIPLQASLTLSYDIFRIGDCGCH